MDYYFFNLINRFALKWLWLDTLAIFFAEYFEYILVFLLFLFLVKNFKKFWPMVLQSFLAAIFARLIVVEIIRYFLPRSRPFVENHVNLLVDRVNQSAFPSGHAAFFFALSTVVYFYNKKTGLFFFFASFLISFFRVFSGVHWPADILVGAVVGIFSGWLIYKVFAWAHSPRTKIKDFIRGRHFTS